MGAAFVSSRTPEGQPNRCPVCGHHVCIEPSLISGDAPCPDCGCMLWFLNLPDRRIVLEHAASQDLRDRVVRIIAQQLGVDPEKVEQDTALINDLGADSLDTVELVMELEEELDLG